MNAATNTLPVDPEILEILATLQEPGQPDILVELLGLFLRDTPERLRELEMQPLRGAVASRVAHVVKGSAGNLGAAHLQQLAGDLEEAGRREASAGELQRLATGLLAEYTRVAGYLDHVLAARHGGLATPGGG